MSGELTVRRYRPGEKRRIETVMETAHRAADAWLMGLDDWDSIVGEHFSAGEFLVGTLGGEIVRIIACRWLADLLAEPLVDVDETTVLSQIAR